MQAQPIDFHPPTEDAAQFLLPVTTTLFADRGDRFAALAKDHSLEDWLRFLGHLSQAQHAALKASPVLTLPSADKLAQAHTHGMPPLNFAERPHHWRTALREIVRFVALDAQESAKSHLDTLATADDVRLEQLADLLVQGEITADDAAVLPFIAAALQVIFTQLASQLDTNQLQKLDVGNICPCCGSPAVASIVRLGASINNLRYLHCSLCNSEWNAPRAVCTTCGSDKNLTLQEIEGAKGTVRAECCDSCKSYLKIVTQEKDPHVDPVADDLATLAIDILVDEAGYERAGPNLLLMSAYNG